MPELTVLIPCFNEEATVAQVIDRVRCELAGMDVQVIVIDDGSTDATVARAEGAITKISEVSATSATQHADFQLIRRPTNGGKTAAVRDGLAAATGDYVLIQDADLEYDPADIPGLLRTAQTGDHVAVYGLRPSHWSKPSRWVLASGVLVVDLAILAFHGTFVRDHATCYKLVRRDVLLAMDLQTSGFEGCVETTCKLIRDGHAIIQVPISYTPRAYDEGKKLHWTHGLTAVKEAWRCKAQTWTSR